MKTITNEIIDKFIEAGLINIKSIDHVRKLEVMRDEFNLMERERIKKAWVDGNYNTDDDGNPSENYSISGEQYYEQTYGGDNK